MHFCFASARPIFTDCRRTASKAAAAHAAAPASAVIRLFHAARATANVCDDADDIWGLCLRQLLAIF